MILTDVQHVSTAKFTSKIRCSQTDAHIGFTVVDSLVSFASASDRFHHKSVWITNMKWILNTNVLMKNRIKHKEKRRQKKPDRETEEAKISEAENYWKISNEFEKAALFHFVFRFVRVHFASNSHNRNCNQNHNHIALMNARKYAHQSSQPSHLERRLWHWLGETFVRKPWRMCAIFCHSHSFDIFAIWLFCHHAKFYQW